MCSMQLVNNLQLPHCFDGCCGGTMWKGLLSIGERLDNSIRVVSFSCEGRGCVSKAILPLPEEVKRKIRCVTCTDIKCARSSVF